MFSGEASPCVSCGISTSSQSKLSSCFAAKLAQDPRSRWHSTTAAASLSPSSRGSESSRAAEGKPCLCTAWGGRVRCHLPAWECHGLWRPGLCRQQGASFRCRVLGAVRGVRLEIHFSGGLGNCGPAGPWHNPEQVEALRARRILDTFPMCWRFLWAQ